MTTINSVDGVTYENNILSIIMPTVYAIQKIQNMPYKKIENIITIEYDKQMQYGTIGITIKIPKKQLFSLIRAQVLSQNIENQNSKQINSRTGNVANTTAINTETNIKVANRPHKIQIPDTVTAIVLCDTRKCIKEEHHIIDTKAKIRIAIFSGKIIEYNISAAYCEICNTFYVLKHDYKEAKKRGIILCQIEDKTQDYLTKHKNNVLSTSWSGNESRIHQLGYNVKKNNGYTQKQRQAVLAYILENTNISKHEIKSIIIKCINQHQSQDNFAQAVSCWRSDLEFVNNYHLGDLPQVKVDKLIVR